MTGNVILAAIACCVPLLDAQQGKKQDLSVEDYLHERRALREARSAVDGLFRFGVDSRAAGRYGEALEAFRDVQQLEPQGIRGLQGMVSVYLAQDRTEDAIQFLEREVSQHPDRLDLLELLADVAANAGQYDLALRTLQSALKLPAGSSRGAADLYARIGAVCQTKRDWDCAIAALRKAKDLNPSSFAVGSALAGVLESAGQTGESAALYRRLLGVDPNDGLALHRQAAELSQASGDLDQALACAQRATSLLPEVGEVSDTLGWIYLKKGQADDAVKVLKALVDKEPNISTYQYHLGLALIGKGDRISARAALENAILFSHTERPDIQAVLLSLDSLRK
jgi:tetratricopeptide (TPR) repeat protein